MFEALVAAITFGTIGFWVVTVIGLIILTSFVENEYDGWAFATLVATVAFFIFIGHIHLVGWVFVHPLKTFLFVLLYFALGTVWGVIKWGFYIQRQIDAYNETKAKILRDFKATVVTPEIARKIKDALKYEYRSDISPQAFEHKKDILRWMTYWPFSVVGTLLHDVVRKIFRTIYARLYNTLQSISDKMTKNVRSEMSLADEGTVQPKR